MIGTGSHRQKDQMVVLTKIIVMVLPSLPDSQGASAQLCVNILSVLFCFALVSFLILKLQSHSKPSTSEPSRARLDLFKPP